MLPQTRVTLTKNECNSGLFKYVSVWEFVIKSKKASFPNSLESFNTSHVVSYSYWSLSLEFDYKQLLFKKPVKSNQTKMLKKLNELLN